MGWVMSALELFWLSWEPNLWSFCPFLYSCASVGLDLFQAIWCSYPLKALKYRQIWYHRLGWWGTRNLVPFISYLLLYMVYIFYVESVTQRRGEWCHGHVYGTKSPHGAHVPSLNQENQPWVSHSEGIVWPLHTSWLYFDLHCPGSSVGLMSNICH